MHVCGVECVCVCMWEPVSVCDGLEKEDKWSVTTEANDFIHQTALWILKKCVCVCVQDEDEGRGRDKKSENKAERMNV